MSKGQPLGSPGGGAIQGACLPEGHLTIGSRHDPTDAIAKKAASRFSLVDLQRRVVRYVRISVTDRCNYRCAYCVPADGIGAVGRDELLRFIEIERLARIFVSMGITRIRLTGGEPLVRRGVVDLVGRLSAIEGIEDLAATTNAHLLGRLAAPLHEAGLRRINVSLDTIDPALFARMTRNGSFPHVLAGLDAADRAGFTNTRLNAVVLRGVNDRGVSDLLGFAADRGYVLRCIEYMPVGVDDFWGPDTWVSATDIRDRLSSDWDLEEGAGGPMAGGGPARYWQAWRRGTEHDPKRAAKVGFITAVSDHFCATCNRIRLSPVGILRECLSSPGVLSLRDMIRAGATDELLSDAIQQALQGKVDGHEFDRSVGTQESMCVIGG